MKNKITKAFTLAEVLITLAIIGIVASLTIPSVISNYKKQQIVAKLKKAYVTLSNTVPMAIKDYGSPDSWSYNNITQFTEKYMIPYLRVQKNCKTSVAKSDREKCAYPMKNLYGDVQNYIAYSYTGIYRFYLTDGTFITTEMGSNAITMFVDINGYKQPNKLGDDVFVFNYYVKGTNKGKIKGYGSNSCSTCNDGVFNGHGCAGYIMKKGWRIPDKKEYQKDVSFCGRDKGKYPW